MEHHSSIESILGKSSSMEHPRGNLGPGASSTLGFFTTSRGARCADSCGTWRAPSKMRRTT